MNENNQMMTVKELADYVCISESTVRKLVRESKIPFVKVLSKILFNKQKVDNWLAEKESIPFKTNY